MANLDDNKAIDINSLSLKGKSDIADYLIIATGTSSRHVSSLAQKTVDDLKNEIDRLSEEVSNLKLINADHKTLNGKLRKQIDKLEKDLKDEKETSLMMYHSP